MYVISVFFHNRCARWRNGNTRDTSVPTSGTHIRNYALSLTLTPDSCPSNYYIIIHRCFFLANRTIVHSAAQSGKVIRIVFDQDVPVYIRNLIIHKICLDKIIIFPFFMLDYYTTIVATMLLSKKIGSVLKEYM